MSEVSRWDILRGVVAAVVLIYGVAIDSAVTTVLGALCVLMLTTEAQTVRIIRAIERKGDE